MLSDRAVEISMAGIGKIKAAAERATIDANAIESLRQRVEAQSATVDLVANSASEARKLAGELSVRIKTTDSKLAEVDKAMQDARHSIAEVESVTNFAAVLIAAESDDWEAFHQIAQWADDIKHPLHDVALKALVKIRISFATPVTRGYVNAQWREGVDPAKMSLSELMAAFVNAQPLVHASVVHVVWNRTDIPKRQRMDFLIQALTQSASLNARDHAARLFIDAAGDKALKWNAFDVKPLVAWWEEHKDRIE
jgi:hypothetical protein